MTALSSITHFGDSVGGTEQVLRRERVLQPDDTFAEVPIISGNSWRGQLRDCGMRAMCDVLAAALGVERLALPPAAFHFLFSGGALSRDDAASVDIGAARRLRELIPLVCLFGGATKGQIMQGKLAVGKIVPVCAETAHILPDTLASSPRTNVSIYDMLAIEHYTRMDDAKRESLAGRYLSAPDQVLLEAPKKRAVKNKQTGENEEVAAAPGKAQQMRYGWEVFAAGTLFACDILLRQVTPLEFEAFASALREWSIEPVLGGRASIGAGRVRLEMGDWFSANPTLRAGEETRGVSAEPFGALYTRHLRGHAGEIVSTLEALS